MYPLTSFNLREMTACGTALRHLADGASCMEEAAGCITRHLYTYLTAGRSSDEPGCVLVRLFKTHSFGELEPERQRAVLSTVSAEPAPWLKCLTLMGTNGRREDWNHATRSRSHLAIPLLGTHAPETMPVVAQLLRQLGYQVPVQSNPVPRFRLDHREHMLNVFYLPQAIGSPYVPDQDDFVVPNGIRSVLGCGGILPEGDAFVLLLFARVLIPSRSVHLFRTLAPCVKLALLPFDGERIFTEGTEQQAPA